jgi:hypothetical protein
MILREDHPPMIELMTLIALTWATLGLVFAVGLCKAASLGDREQDGRLGNSHGPTAAPLPPADRTNA